MLKLFVFNDYYVKRPINNTPSEMRKTMWENPIMLFSFIFIFHSFVRYFPFGFCSFRKCQMLHQFICTFVFFFGLFVVKQYLKKWKCKTAWRYWMFYFCIDVILIILQLIFVKNRNISANILGIVLQRKFSFFIMKLLSGNFHKTFHISADAKQILAQ